VPTTDGLMRDMVKAYYDSPGVPEAYAKRTTLLPEEEFVIHRLRDALQHGRFLEIGVGQGRTTQYLKALAREYVGIDYSENMLKVCQARYPDATLLVCDARAMPFPNASFDVIYFCWNALDDAGHTDRLSMLKEIHRVLKPGGTFFFSSHNYEAPLRSPYRPRGLVLSLDPRRMVGQNLNALRRYGRGVWNHLQRRKYVRWEEDYAIINDQSNDFGLLTYCIKKEAQIRQLEAHGFGKVEMISRERRLLQPGEPCTDAWIFYIARKP
jgi:SAM-dependent methyltransferase